MTRRKIKKQPNKDLGWCGTGKKYWSEHPDDLKAKYFKCPYGSIGDILWVRETFQPINHPELKYRYRADHLHPQDVNWKPSIFMPKNACRLFLKVKNILVERLQDISEADAEKEGAEPVLYHLSSQKMEVIKLTHVFYEHAYAKFQTGFKMLWSKINGQKSWDENPFVWVITFEITDCPKGFC